MEDGNRAYPPSFNDEAVEEVIDELGLPDEGHWGRFYCEYLRDRDSWSLLELTFLLSLNDDLMKSFWVGHWPGTFAKWQDFVRRHGVTPPALPDVQRAVAQGELTATEFDGQCFVAQEEAWLWVVASSLPNDARAKLKSEIQALQGVHAEANAGAADDCGETVSLPARSLTTVKHGNAINGEDRRYEWITAANWALKLDDEKYEWCRRPSGVPYDGRVASRLVEWFEKYPGKKHLKRLLTHDRLRHLLGKMIKAEEDGVYWYMPDEGVTPPS